jgi:deoxycytidylate deaminase
MCFNFPSPVTLLQINAHLKNFIFSVKKGIRLNNYRMALIACAFFVAYSGADAAVDSSSPDGSKRLVVIESATDEIVKAILYSRHNGKTTKQDISLGDLSHSTVTPDNLDVIWPEKGPYVVLFAQFRHDAGNYFADTSAKKPMLILLKEPDWDEIFAKMGKIPDPGDHVRADCGAAIFKSPRILSVGYEPYLNNESYDFICLYDLVRNGAIKSSTPVKQLK